MQRPAAARVAPGAPRRSAPPEAGASSGLRRRRLLAAFALSLGGAGRLGAEPAGTVLPAPASLAQALAAALAARQPLVVMASLHGCPFCKVVRESHLAPLLASGQAVVQIDLQAATPVRDFAGVPTTHGKLLRDWGVAVAPTVLFFGRGGREVAPRLEGASIPDFYGAYLEQRLAAARAGLG